MTAQKNNQKSAEKSQNQENNSNAKNTATGEKNTEKSAGQTSDKKTKNAANSAASAKQDPVLQALEQATPTPGKPNQLETKLEDGSKVIFRKDFGENSHGLPDHYNIEIHKPSSTKPGRNEAYSDWQIIPDKSGGLEIYDSLEKQRIKKKK